MKEFNEIKEKSKKALKYHRFYSIVVCFLVSSVLSFGYKFNSGLPIEIPGISLGSVSNLAVLKNFLRVIHLEKFLMPLFNYKPTVGVIATFLNQLSGTGSIVFTLFNMINNLVFRKIIPSAGILALSILAFLLIYIFVATVLNVGKSRYFLEHSTYQDTSVRKLLFVYYTKSIFNVGEVMLIKMLKSFLWYFTIIGGFIKHYEYSMIPYILAENPSIKQQEAFKISKEMTRGRKVELFRLDISFIPWYILGYLSLGFSNIFYFRPYKEMVKANMYLEYRRVLKNKYSYVFKDDYLDLPSTRGCYPDNLYFIKEIKNIKVTKYDYNIDYKLSDLILIFFTVAMVGWLWEIMLCLIYEERLVNKGTMMGPWLPIYGYGAVLILMLLKKYRKKPLNLFLMAFLVCGILEYTTAWYLETFKGLKWWDYTGYFLNIQGRICLEGLMFFGFGGCILTYLVGPLLYNIYKKISPKVKRVLCIILVSLYLVDLCYSHYHPNTGVGITSPVKINIVDERLH